MVSFGRFRRRSTGQKKDPVRTLLNIFIFCLIWAGLWFICLNIAPYIKFVTAFSKQVVFFRNDLPSQTLLVIFGTCFWAILQFLQLFPILLFSSEKFMKTMIDRSNARSPVKINEHDEPIVQKMKGAYNALPTSFVANLERWCVISYLLDFYVNCSINSPLIGGWNVLGNMLLYGRFELLDWKNIFLNLQTIFAVELIVFMLIWTLSLIAAFNDNVQPQR
jgi:hypothetical protein